MLSFAFKTIFWVSVVWICIGKPMDIHNSAISQQAAQKYQQITTTANTVQQVCAMMAEHPSCKSVNAIAHDIESLKAPKTPAPTKRPEQPRL